MRGGSGCEVSILASHKPSGVFLVTLSTEVLSELKMMTYFFVKSAENLESHSCPIENRLALFRLGYLWACGDFVGNIGRIRYT